MKRRARVLLGCTASLVLAPLAVLHPQSGAGVRLDTIPASLPSHMARPLIVLRASLERAIDSANGAVPEFNRRCSEIRTEAQLSQCQQDAGRFKAFASTMEDRKRDFNVAVRAAIDEARRAAATPGLRTTEPPSPEVAREQARFRDNPERWLREREEDVRRAVLRNVQWTRTILQLLNAPRQSQRRYEITRLDQLSAGDVILVAPPNEQLDPAGSLSSQAIRHGDAAYRVVAEFVTGRIAGAARQDLEPASHALTFVGPVSGIRMYLSQDIGGPRMLTEEQLLREYGAREMYVARPQAIVDGRLLWDAASNTARGNPSNYGCIGDGRYVCSETTGIVVARATGIDMSTDRIGPIDVTPGDFFDRTGNVGKHFVVTRLRITGTSAGPGSF